MSRRAAPKAHGTAARSAEGSPVSRRAVPKTRPIGDVGLGVAVQASAFGPPLFTVS